MKGGLKQMKQEIKQNISRFAKIGGLAVALVLGAKTYQNFNASSKVLEENRARPTNVLARIESSLYGPEVRFYTPQSARYDIAEKEYAWDINNDGIVDALGSGGVARFYSSDWKGAKYNDAREMSPEVRKLASEYLVLSKKLNRRIYLDIIATNKPEQDKQ